MELTIAIYQYTDIFQSATAIDLSPVEPLIIAMLLIFFSSKSRLQSWELVKIAVT